MNYLKKTKKKQTKKTLKSLPKPGIELGTSGTPVRCVTSRPPSQLKVLVIVKLCTCVNAMGRNVNKQSRYSSFLSYLYVYVQLLLKKKMYTILAKRYRHSLFIHITHCSVPMRCIVRFFIQSTESPSDNRDTARRP